MFLCYTGSIHPTYEKEVKKETARLLDEYYNGTLDKSDISEDFDPDYEINRLARANVLAEINKEYINSSIALIENVEFTGKYAPYVCLSLKMSNIAALAALDYVCSIYEYEDAGCSNDESLIDEPFFREDPSRFEDTDAEGYPLDLGFDGTDWIHTDGWTDGDVDRDGRVTAADARLALRASVGLWTPFIYEQFYAADIDGDYKITSFDARAILRTAVGL